MSEKLLKSNKVNTVGLIIIGYDGWSQFEIIMCTGTA